MIFNTQSREYIENSSLAKCLNPKELEMLIAYNEIKIFKSHSIILKQGSFLNGIYLITQGTVTISIRIFGAGIAQIETLGPGQFLGEISFMEDVPCTTSALADTEVQCLFLTKPYYEMISLYYPEVKYKLQTEIAKQVCVRLKKMHDKIIEIIQQTEMKQRSVFSDWINSLTKPEILSTEHLVKTYHINQLAILKDLTDIEIADFLKHVEYLRVPKHCILIHEAEKKSQCYIILQGAVLSSIVKKNKIAKLSVIGPTTLFASTSCIDSNDEFTITFTTCEKTLLLKINEENIAYFKNYQPKLWYRIFDYICHSVIALEKSVDKLDIRLQVEIYNR